MTTSAGPLPTPTPTLSLHDALPISERRREVARPDLVDFGHRGKAIGLELHRAARRENPGLRPLAPSAADRLARLAHGDRKSTRLNSSHLVISYAVFWLTNKTASK